MRRRRRRSLLADASPSPEGPRWLPIGEARVASAGLGADLDLDPRLEGQLEHLGRAASLGPDWRRAEAALECLVRVRAGLEAKIEIGRVRRLGEGLSRVAFVAGVEVIPDPTALSDTYVLLGLRAGADSIAARAMVRELEVLEHLQGLPLSFRIPRALGALWTEGQLFVLQSLVEGYPVELRAPRAGPVPPWEVVGSVAAGIHQIDPDPLVPAFGGPCSWRDHVEQLLPELEAVDAAEGRAAATWVKSRIPEDAPGVLLHGDLLGQNIYEPLMRDGEGGYGVVDWERAGVGHPAYDLATVTRGHRRPFETEGGLRRLLEVYLGAGGASIGPPDVHLFELVLAAGWYRDALARESLQAARQQLRVLSGILTRAQASES